MSSRNQTSPSVPTESMPSVSRVPVPTGYKDGQRYRQREVGTGYGRSSGYARNRKYAQNEVNAIFSFG